MPTSPQIAASLIVLSAASLAIHLAVSPAPLAASSATVVAIGAVIFTVISVVGLLLVRGRWARYLGMVLSAVVLAVAATADELGGWAVAAVLTGLAALGTLAGRWLDGWIRARPSATGPPPRAVLLLLGLLGLVPAVGLAAPSGLTTAHGMVGSAGVLLAWGYGKAHLWALWATRLVLPFLVVAAALASPLAGAVGLLAYGAALSWLAWSEEVRLAVQPLLDSAPGPRRLRNQDRGATP